MPLVDANLFLRYLTRDEPVKAERVRALFERAERGEVMLLTTEMTIAEVVFVLSSTHWYHLPRAEVRDLLMPIVNARSIKLAGRQAVQRALDLYSSTPIDFIDALMAAHMEQMKIPEIYTYDQHFDLVPGIARLEP